MTLAAVSGGAWALGGLWGRCPQSVASSAPPPAASSAASLMDSLS